VLPLRDDNPTRRRAAVTLLLLAVNVGVYVFLQPDPVDPEATARFNFERAAIPCEITTGDPLTIGEVVATVNGLGDDGDLCDADTAGAPEAFPQKSIALSVLASMFLHGSLVHLGGNMLFLWIFGNNIEDRLGRIRYVIFYLAAGVVATLTHVALQPDSTVPLVGASGAIAGVMGAYLVWFPRVPILSWFAIFLVPVQARWLLVYWFVSQFFINPNEGVAWAAHVGGFVFGVLVALAVRFGDRARFRRSWV
jgi:membrane associated rhomboid family serine protease